MFERIILKIIFICTLLTSCSIQQHSYIGINTHVAYNFFDETRHEEIRSMSELGIKFARIDWQGKTVPSSDDKSLHRLDESLVLFSKYGIEVVIVFPTMPSNDDEIQPYVDLIEFIAKRYDGKTAITVNEEFFKPLVKYFQIGNEMHFQRFRNPQINNPESLWMINKFGAQAVRRVRKDAINIFGAIFESSACQEYIDWMCTYQDIEGTSVEDLYDIVSLHFYKDNVNSLLQSYDKLKTMIKATPLAQKPIWVTECGINTYEYSEREQSEYLAPSVLALLSTGVEKCFWYTFRDFGGNLFSREKSINNREDYFGIIGPSVVSPSVSFLCNDSSNKAISRGDALNQVLAKFPWKTRTFVDMPMGKGSTEIIKNLKETGLHVQGKDVTISRIVKQKQFESDPKTDQTIYLSQLNSLSATEVHLPASSFANIKEGDVVRVYFDNVKDATANWRFDPKPAYFDFRNLLDLFSEDCAKPSIEHSDNGLYIWQWEKTSGEYIYALWSTQPKLVEITSHKGKYNLQDSKGNTILHSSNNIVNVSQSIIFVIGSKKYKFNVID